VSTRTYGQLCPVARALDIVGERWTLLIIRELLLGPKRYRDLLAQLSTMGTNRLSDRLKTLTAHGIISRRVLSAPADGAVYELTELGEELRPLILGLASWGSKLAPQESADPQSARAELIALSVAARTPPTATIGLRENYDFRVGDEHFHIAIDDGTAAARSGPSPTDPAITVDCDLPTFAQLTSGQMSPSRALRSSAVEIDRKPSELTRAIRVLTAR
jgi:DNA-binding HxlR family transcriptional regulator